MLDISLNVRHLLGPAAVVHSECLKPAILGNCIKSGFPQKKNGAAVLRLEPELDQGRRLARGVDRGIDRIGVPAKRKEPLGLHLLHRRLPLDVLVAGMSDAASRNLSRHEWSLQLHPKPFTKLAVVRQRAPDTGYGRL